MNSLNSLDVFWLEKKANARQYEPKMLQSVHLLTKSYYQPRMNINGVTKKLL
jgi:hypothetical protein